MKLSAEQRGALLRDPRGWLASAFGSGLFPRAPGTFGTLTALPVCWWLGAHTSLTWYLLIWTLIFAIGCWSAGWVIGTLQVEDPGVVVIDEWVGMALTWLPVAYWPGPHSQLLWLGPAFLIFRVCDIAKPWPASWADQKLHGGFGAMFDDVLAGVWAALLVLAGLYLLG